MDRNGYDLSDYTRFTAYALGELTESEATAFEAELAESPLAQKEMSATQTLMGALTEGLQSEWEQITEEVPSKEDQITAYALGELDSADQDGLRDKIDASSELSAELEAIQSIAAMLTEGFQAELAEHTDSDLTTYALGEMDADEMAAFTDFDADELAATQSMADLLSDSFAAELDQHLTEAKPAFTVIDGGLD
ncbi:MAG: hypothetical protein AAF226_14260, partial [Verrucomicrobiota bacterium]